MALEFARREGGHGLPYKGTRPAVWGDECSEIGLKFLPDYYLSTTVEYPVQKFSPTGYKIFPDAGAQHPRREAWPPPPSGATPARK
ncbi:hypothetical protein AVEN_161028-1 [Araneus ventricosus]|uniref:Uncharacterized protein n=1 Tax=Araneus ventricosus TaxID=182803 RepID=A0A4Y2W7P3_ARAVE|nr:hypothetical protein AVEN_161028-1 [Araneus ventricosus]